MPKPVNSKLNFQIHGFWLSDSVAMVQLRVIEGIESRINEKEKALSFQERLSYVTRAESNARLAAWFEDQRVTISATGLVGELSHSSTSVAGLALKQFLLLTLQGFTSATFLS